MTTACVLHNAMSTARSTLITPLSAHKYKESYSMWQSAAWILCSVSSDLRQDLDSRYMNTHVALAFLSTILGWTKWGSISFTAFGWDDEAPAALSDFVQSSSRALHPNIFKKMTDGRGPCVPTKILVCWYLDMGVLRRLPSYLNVARHSLSLVN
jgi:hypothetical protein